MAIALIVSVPATSMEALYLLEEVDGVVPLVV
jgi:hypothetical protein